MLEYIIIILAIGILISAFLITRPLVVKKTNRGAKDIIEILAKKDIKKLIIKRGRLSIVRNNLKKGETLEVILPHSADVVNISDEKGKINVNV